MQTVFSKPISKAIIDVLLIVGFFVSNLSSRHSGSDSWGSFHCIASIIGYALILVHIGQHGRMTKSLTKPKVMRRNIITTLTAGAFILTTFSVILFIFGINRQSVQIHHAIAHIFWMVIFIHAITKTKRFIYLFKRKQ